MEARSWLFSGVRFVMTDYGNVQVGPTEGLYEVLAGAMLEATQRVAPRGPRIGLSGGGTPQAFFRWAAEPGRLAPEVVAKALWLTSDERFVPREDAESNFGNADRLLLDALEIPEPRRLNWPVQVDPHSASIVFNQRWNDRFGAHQAFDLCLLGIGADGHTASLFPGSPVLGSHIVDNFVCVDVPGKGWRLTITESGLGRCGQIIVLVIGEEKAGVVRDILTGKPDPQRLPAQILARLKERTLWLMDEGAAGLLPES